MTKQKIITIVMLIIISIAGNAYSTHVFNLPDSPDPSDFTDSTWDDHNWTEIEITQEGQILSWSIQFNMDNNLLVV